MAGLSGKSAWLGIARNNAAGDRSTNSSPAVPAPSAPTYKVPFSGGSIGPVRETDRLSETDTSRDQSAAYVTTSGVEGSPEVYVRLDSIGAFLNAVMGSVTAVAGPPVVHTFKPAQALPYYTMWRNVGGANGIYEQYVDCFVSSATFSAEAGSPLGCAMSVQGLLTNPIQSTPTKTSLDAVALGSAVVPNFNIATVSLGGGVATPTNVRNIRSFELTIENNASRQQTDDVVPYDVVPGTREISLGFDLIFQNADEYFKFHTGTNSGTAISPNIYTTNAEFEFIIDANNKIKFTLPSIAYEEFPVEPDPGGDPIIVPVRAVAQKATGVTDLLTVVLTNSVASYNV